MQWVRRWVLINYRLYEKKKLVRITLLVKLSIIIVIWIHSNWIGMRQHKKTKYKNKEHAAKLKGSWQHKMVSRWERVTNSSPTSSPLNPSHNLYKSRDGMEATTWNENENWESANGQRKTHRLCSWCFNLRGLLDSQRIAW